MYTTTNKHRFATVVTLPILLIHAMLLVSCTKGSDVSSPIEASTSTIASGEVATKSPEPTATQEMTPTATEVKTSSRPDFESMTDSELLTTIKELGGFFANQVDCLPGTENLPQASVEPEIVPRPGYSSIFWKTEYLGSYQAQLIGHDNLIAGYINCLYFASSIPGEVFTVMGGGKLWGDDIYVDADHKLFGVPLEIENILDTVSAEKLLPLLNQGEQYELEVGAESCDSCGLLNAPTVEQELLTRQASIEVGFIWLIRIYLNSDIIYWIKNSINSNYPATNRWELISNPSKPVRARIIPVEGN